LRRLPLLIEVFAGKERYPPAPESGLLAPELHGAYGQHHQCGDEEQSDVQNPACDTRDQDQHSDDPR
jgi:hypothetical protein